MTRSPLLQMARAHTMLSRGVTALVNDHQVLVEFDEVAGIYSAAVGDASFGARFSLDGDMPDQSLVIVMAPVDGVDPRPGMALTVDGRPWRIQEPRIHPSAWVLTLASENQ